MPSLIHASTSDEDLRTRVVLKAMTLPERIKLFRRCPDALSVAPTRSSQRLSAWMHVLGIGADESIRRRLNTLGIETGELDLVLGDVNPAAISDIEIPGWWEICERVLARPRALAPDELPSADFLTGNATPSDLDFEKVDPAYEEPPPFEHALVTWVEVATDLLRDELPGVEMILGPTVLRREQRGLLENLCMLARSSLLRRFRLLKLGTYGANDMVLGLFTNEPPCKVYIATVQAVLIDGFADLMRSRPALARLLATRVECWVRTLAEFARCLEADRSELERVFNNGEPLGRLVNGGRGISDSHNGGRAVMICRFEYGTCVVYKPRSMSVDAAWNSIVESFNAQVIPNLQLKSLVVLERGCHGWMEFSGRTPCKDDNEVRLFYRRIGSLLSLIHTLQGNDFHLENIVAAGPHPVAIDLETISVPEPLVDTAGAEPDMAAELISRSVLRTLLLPSVMGMRDRAGVRNLGAVGVEVEVEAGGMRTHRRLIKINTDFQRWISVPGDDLRLRLDEQSKVELSSGASVDPNDYRDEVIAGYRAAYSSILEHRSTWLADDGPLAALKDCWVRVINRATDIYYRLLQETCNDKLLESGVDRWIHGDRLLVNTQSGTEGDETVFATGIALLAAEQAALLRGDIAYFVARGSGLDYFSPDTVSGEPALLLGAHLMGSAVESARRQIAAMCEEDLNLQVFLMNSSYLTAQISADQIFHGRRDKTVPFAAESRPIPSRDKIEAWITRGLEHIDALTIRRGGGTNWIDLIPDPQTETVRPSAMSTGLYSGRGGIALLFERAYRHFGNPRWLKLAQESIDGEFQRAKSAHSHGRFLGLELEGPSGMMNRPGLVAACWAIGRHQGRGAYREVARTLLIDLTERIIERDTSYDLIAGSAGYLMLVLHLEREERIPCLEPLLRLLGDHLMRHATDIDGTGWRAAPNNRPLNGLGHGRAGIGLALLEVGTRLNRSDLRDLGLSALRAEHEMRSDEPGNGWPDLRYVEVGAPIPRGPQINSWCAGGDGIALSRAAAMTYADDAFLRDDLDYAIACMRNQPVINRGHLCCGRTGRAEAWRTLGRIMGDQDLLVEASIALTKGVDVHETDPTSPDTGTIGLSLMQGAAGRIWAALSEVMNDDGSALLLLRV